MNIHSVIKNNSPEEITVILDELEAKLSNNEFYDYLHRKGFISINEKSKKIIFPVIFEHNCTIEKIKVLMEYGFDINITDENGKNALFYVNAEKSKFLIDSGIEKKIFIPNNKMMKGSPVFNTSLKKLKILLDFGYDINEKDYLSRSLLFSAPDIETVDFLIEQGFSPSNDIDKNGNNVLFSSNLRPEVYEYLIQKGADVNHKNNIGFTPLFVSNIEQTKILLKNNPDINISANDYSNAAFHTAESNGLEKLKLLKEQNIKLNGKDCIGKSILYYSKDPEILEFLLKNGVNFDESENFIKRPSNILQEKLIKKISLKVVADKEKESILESLKDDTLNPIKKKRI